MTEPVDLEELNRLLAVAKRGQDGGYFLTVIVPALIEELEALRQKLADQPSGYMPEDDGDDDSI